MLLSMSENIPNGNRGDGELRRRFANNVSDEQQEIQDWLNGNGQAVIAGIFLFIICFAIAATVWG